MPAPNDDYVPDAIHIMVQGADETSSTSIVEVGLTIDTHYGNHGDLNMEMATIAAQAARDWLENHPTYNFVINANIDYLGHRVDPLP